MELLKTLSEKEKKELETGVIQVYGKAMNRTALGIVDAFISLYPHATFGELKEALNDDCNPSGPVQVKTIFAPYTERKLGVVQPGKIREEFKKEGLEIGMSFFMVDKEIFKTSDGVEVLTTRLWESKDSQTGKKDLEVLIERAAKYGIRVTEFEPKQPFKKGRYQLEVINPVLMKFLSTKKEPEKMVKSKPQPAQKKDKKKSFPMWIIGLLALLVILIVLFFLFNKKEELPVAKVEIVDVITPTVVREEKEVVTITQLTTDLKEGKSIEGKKFTISNIMYAQGKNELSEESFPVIDKAVDFLKENTEVKLKIVGHASQEGTDEYNLKLSKERSKAVYDYLIKKGINEDRLQHEGRGSSELKTSEETEAGYTLNRRTEFEVISQ